VCPAVLVYLVCHIYLVYLVYPEVLEIRLFLGFLEHLLYLVRLVILSCLEGPVCLEDLERRTHHQVLVIPGLLVFLGILENLVNL
jgi:hypothetical protein